MIAKLAQLVGGLSEGERAGEIQDRHIAHDTLYDDHLTTPAPLDLERTSLLSLWFGYCRSPSDNFGIVRGPPDTHQDTCPIPLANKGGHLRMRE